jgi:hypothetical protein
VLRSVFEVSIVCPTAALGMPQKPGGMLPMRYLTLRQVTKKGGKLARPAGFEPATPRLEVPSRRLHGNPENAFYFQINRIAVHPI